MTDTISHESDDLGAQTAWLRALALRLVSDRSAADDLVQETLLVALKAPGQRHHAGSPTLQETRAWLYGIVRNVARTGRRTAARRAGHEHRYAALKPTIAAGTDEVVERASRAKRLFDEVLALDEPYRTAVLLSYEERLDAPTIAARTGVTPVAARKRISRGVQILRDRLGAQDSGHRPTWLMSLAGLRELPSTTPNLLIAGATMSAKWTVAAATLLVIAGLGYWASSERHAPAATAATLAQSEGAEGAVSPLAELTDVRPEKALETRVAGETPSEEPILPATEPSILRGRVLLSDDSTPVIGANLRASQGSQRTQRPGGEVLALTDRQGLFQIHFENAQAFEALAQGLWVEHEEVFDVHVEPARISTLEGEVLEIRTVGLGEVEVLVLNSEGQPAPGVDLAYSMKPTFGSDEQLWSYQGSLAAGKSDASGRHTISGLPVGTTIHLGAAGEWEQPATAVIDPVTGRGEATLTLVGWASVMARLAWADGTPAAGVRARWSGTPSKSGDFRPVQAKSDDAGLLRIDDLSGGGGVLQFFAQAYHAPVHARVTRGETTDLGDLALLRSCRLAGQVVAGGVIADQAKSMATELTVYALRDGALVAQADLKPDLKFELTVPAGPLTLAAGKDVNWDATLPYQRSLLGSALVTAPREDVELEITAPFGWVTGRADASNGQPSITLFASEPSVAWGSPSALDRAASFRAKWEGDRFSVPVAPQKAIRVLIKSSEGQAAYSDPMEIPAGQTVDLGQLGFARGPLTVHVTGAGQEVSEGVLVTAVNGSRQEAQARTDAEGIATFDLDVGPYAVRAGAGDGAVTPWQLIHVEPNGTPRLDLTLGEEGFLSGTVYGDAGPVEGVGLKAQRSEPFSNLQLAATTGARGAFAFKPLQAGVYRYWISDELVGSVRVASGATTKLDLELTTHKAIVSVLRDGKPFTEVRGLTASAMGPGDGLWHSAQALGGGRFEVRLPKGPLEFTLDLNGLGNNQSIHVLAPAADGDRFSLELPSTGLEVRIRGSAAHAPWPAAFLRELEGEPLETLWGTDAELYAEDLGVDERGVRVVRFPFIDAGARVELRGTRSSGVQRTETVTVGPGGWTTVEWD